MDKDKDKQLAEQINKLHDFCSIMTKKLKDPSIQLELKLGQLSQKFGSFFSSAPNEIRTKFAYYLQKQIRIFLLSFVKPRLQKLCANKVQPFSFIDQICDIWQNYERFIYSLKFYSSAADGTYKNFFRFAARFETLMINQQNADKADPNYKNQVSPIPVMAVNQLKYFLRNQKLLDNLINNFVKIFCDFIKQQRQGINTPRDKINQALQFVEAIHLDYDSDCVRKDDRLKIVRSINQSAPNGRRSTANSFFEKNFTSIIFKDTQAYYRQWVINKGLNISASDQTKQIIKFLQKQQERAKFYIHDEKNEKKYLQIVQANLIEYKIQQRLSKTTGLQYFLVNYELDKPQMIQQIRNFWKVYKRVYFKQNDCKKTVLFIYNNYLTQQSLNISKSYEKASQFIDQIIKLNKKNLQIIEQLLDNVFDFTNIKVDIIQRLLIMQFASGKGANQQVDQHIGAKQWAAYLNAKVRTKYGKSQPYNQNEQDIMNIYKLLIKKKTALDEHCKHLATRLLEDIDISLQAQYSNAIDIQLKILQKIKKQSAQNQTKSIQGCIKDVQSSVELRSKLKQSKKVSSFAFFNQLIKKTGNFWTDTSMYDIKPPNLIKDCLTVIRDELTNQNLVFQLHNGASLFSCTIKNQVLRFQLKNIYLMALLLIDQKPNKKMFYTDLTKQIKPLGVGNGKVKAEVDLNKILVEMVCYGLLKCNRQFKQDTADVQNWSAIDYFQINLQFNPKKQPCHRTSHLTAQTDFPRRAFTALLSKYDTEKRKQQQVRLYVVKNDCLKFLKASQSNEQTQGTISFDELLKRQRRQFNVDQRYLKQVIQNLIRQGNCQRVEDKKNIYRYKG